MNEETRCRTIKGGGRRGRFIYNFMWRMIDKEVSSFVVCSSAKFVCLTIINNTLIDGAEYHAVRASKSS